MIYDHGKKAGNLGDVWKHAVLVSIASRIPAATPFRYVESHSGGPCHSLHKVGEWRRGIEAVLERGNDNDHPYLRLARTSIAESRYEAGWLFFARALAPRVPIISTVLCDNSPSVAGEYRPLSAELSLGNLRIDFRQVDGYAEIANVDADLVFIDPPYHPDAEADWKRLGDACRGLRRRGISFLAWYPFYWQSKPRRLVDTTRETAWEVTWAPCGDKPSQNLKGCGILVSEALLPLIESARSELAAIARRINETGSIVIRAPGAG